MTVERYISPEEQKKLDDAASQEEKKKLAEMVSKVPYRYIFLHMVWPFGLVQPPKKLLLWVSTQRLCSWLFPL